MSRFDPRRERRGGVRTESALQGAARRGAARRGELRRGEGRRGEPPRSRVERLRDAHGGAARRALATGPAGGACEGAQPGAPCGSPTRLRQQGGLHRHHRRQRRAPADRVPLSADALREQRDVESRAASEAERRRRPSDVEHRATRARRSLLGLGRAPRSARRPLSGRNPGCGPS